MSKLLKSEELVKFLLNLLEKKMRFTKKGNIYRIIQLTGSQDNILGVSFGEDNKMEILEWPIEEGEKIRTSKKEVLEQIISGLESVNQSLGTNSKLSKIYFLPSDRASYSVYSLLICKLIRHYHSGNEFKEL
jgi:hypothetical protein